MDVEAELKVTGCQAKGSIDYALLYARFSIVVVEVCVTMLPLFALACA